LKKPKKKKGTGGLRKGKWGGNGKPGGGGERRSRVCCVRKRPEQKSTLDRTGGGMHLPEKIEREGTCVGTRLGKLATLGEEVDRWGKTLQDFENRLPGNEYPKKKKKKNKRTEGARGGTKKGASAELKTPT